MSADHDNPLLRGDHLPPFSLIRPEHTAPAVDHLLAEARQVVADLTKTDREHTWESLVRPLEQIDDRINRAWSPIGHLHAVADNPELREAFTECVAKLSEYSTELGQNKRLFHGFESIADSPQYAKLEQAQKKTIGNALRDFHLAGVDLNRKKKSRYKAISIRLSELSTKFGENVLDATQGWKKHITDEAQLSGLPETTREFARETAHREGLPGWVLTLEASCYLPVMSYADDGELRYQMYQASTTRASDQGPNAGRWDNSALLDEILALRHEKATLLGFSNYSEYSLATKMAPSTEEVIDFLCRLTAHASPVAQTELADLKQFSTDHYQVAELETWDIPYYSEKLRQHQFDITQEELRPYFPVERVLGGLFDVVARLYGLVIEPVDEVDSWHKHVRLYTIHGPDGDLRGHFYLDLYSRPHKRGGAWMDECVVRKRDGDALQTPVAYIVCNLTPPLGANPALLTHDDVTTLFHEFGHGLHHLLTQVDYPSVAGINGVEWDAVELPSQIMENWCWEYQTIQLISEHHQTGEPLPDALFERLRAAKNFQAGMRMIRQIEFALFDFRVHLEFDTARGPRVQETLAQVRREVAVVHPPAFNRFAHSFSHIFGGGYAAGYYSYLWAEVLSSDAFSRFEENGVFDRNTGSAFMRSVLERGGSQDAMDLFVEFRGREPSIEALLRHSGIDSRAT